MLSHRVSLENWETAFNETFPKPRILCCSASSLHRVTWKVMPLRLEVTACCAIWRLNFCCFFYWIRCNTLDFRSYDLLRTEMTPKSHEFSEKSLENMADEFEFNIVGLRCTLCGGYAVFVVRTSYTRPIQYNRLWFDSPPPWCRRYLVA